MEKKPEDDTFRIENLEEFIKEYKDYKYYKEVDDFTILGLLEAGYFKYNPVLELNDSEAITNNLFKKLAQNEKAQTIKKMILTDLIIDAKAFLNLKDSKFFYLEELHLKSCEKLTGKGLASYFQSHLVRILKVLTLDTIEIDDSVK